MITATPTRTTFVAIGDPFWGSKNGAPEASQSVRTMIRPVAYILQEALTMPELSYSRPHGLAINACDGQTDRQTPAVTGAPLVCTFDEVLRESAVRFQSDSIRRR